MKIVKDNAKFRTSLCWNFHWPLLQISDYNKPHYIININHQTETWNENQSASKTRRFYF